MEVVLCCLVLSCLVLDLIAILVRREINPTGKMSFREERKKDAAKEKDETRSVTIFWGNNTTSYKY